MEPVDTSWFLILFGQLQGFSTFIRHYVGASLIMWAQLSKFLLGTKYLENAQNIYGYPSHLFSAFQRAMIKFEDMTANTFLITQLLKPCHYIHMQNHNAIISFNRRTKVYLTHGESTSSCPSGLRSSSSHVQALHYQQGCLTPRIMLDCSYMGLFEVPHRYFLMAYNFATIPYDSFDTCLIFEDHVASLIQRAMDNEIDLSHKPIPIDPTARTIMSGKIELQVPYGMPCSAFKYSPLENAFPVQPTHMMRHMDVQEVMLFLSVYTRSSTRDFPSDKVISNFLPFIESVFRTTLVRNARICLGKSIPSTPWTIALAYFTQLPVPQGYYPLVDAFYTYHSRVQSMQLMWNDYHLDDLIQILEWWWRVLDSYGRIWPELEINPLHNEYNMSIFHAVCSTIFVNVVRSLVIGIVEPYMCPRFLGVNRLNQLRKKHFIYDFDEFSSSTIDYEDITVRPAFMETMTNSVFLTIKSAKSKHMVMRLCNVINHIQDIIQCPRKGRSCKFPVRYRYEFPSELNFEEASDLQVHVYTSTTSLEHYMQHLMRTEFAFNDIFYEGRSTHTMVFQDLGCWIDEEDGGSLKFNVSDDWDSPRTDEDLGVLFNSLEYFLKNFCGEYDEPQHNIIQAV